MDNFKYLDSMVNKMSLDNESVIQTASVAVNKLDVIIFRNEHILLPIKFVINL